MGEKYAFNTHAIRIIFVMRLRYAFNTEIMRISFFADQKVQYISTFVLTTTIYCGI